MATSRLTAAERREHVFEPALQHFADRGLHGASTDEIARMANISQPYLFRLYGSKRELFIATCRRVFDEILETLRGAAAGQRDEESLPTIERAYRQEILSDRRRVRLILQASAAAVDDAAIREVVCCGYDALISYLEPLAGSRLRARSLISLGILVALFDDLGVGKTAAPAASNGSSERPVGATRRLVSASPQR
jgi:AcrR family transcriptional regulator